MNEEQATTSAPDWTKLRGTVLEGGYEIQELLGADQNGWSFKVRVLGDASAHARVNIFKAEGEGAQEQIELWESAKGFEHPNLSTPLAAGRVQVNSADLIYVVLRRPDELLEDALRERPLGVGEAGEILLALSAALQYLHTRGFVHGCVSPEQVAAVGDSVQLSAEWVRRAGFGSGLRLRTAKYTAPESAEENVTPEADVWCLGATLFEALTRKECRNGCREGAAQLGRPLGNIAARCLDPDPQARCKLDEAAAMYPGEESPLAKPKAYPIQETPQARTPARRLADEKPGPNRKLWVYAAVVLLVVCGVIWFARSRPRATPAAAVPASVTQTAAPSNRDNISPALTPSPEVRAAVSQPRAEVAQPAPKRRAASQEPATVNGPVWRLVLYTYAREQDAQNRARSINEKHPALKAEVFSPQGQHAAYLVVAGGHMNHDQAARLRRKAIGMGLPRDTYIQNYQQ